jgi:hypothetical protein
MIIIEGTSGLWQTPSHANQGGSSRDPTRMVGHTAHNLDGTRRQDDLAHVTLDYIVAIAGPMFSSGTWIRKSAETSMLLHRQEFQTKSSKRPLLELTDRAIFYVKGTQDGIEGVLEQDAGWTRSEGTGHVPRVALPYR